jgi:acyl transferase domain-containing protein
MTVKHNLIFLFSGQGAQYPEMLINQCQDVPEVKSLLSSCMNHFTLLGCPLASIWSTDAINETRYTQPALFCVEYALGQYWLNQGIQPALMIGHSIGELVAATLSGVMSLETACRLVYQRALHMDQVAVDGGMLAVLASIESWQHLLPETLDIAAYNAPNQTVVSGDRSALESFQQTLKAQGIRAIPLTVSHPFHSRLMAKALPPFASSIESFEFASPRYTIIGNLTHAPITHYDAKYWCDHIVKPVHFVQSIEYVMNHMTNQPVFIEMGPQPVLINLIKRYVKDATFLPALEKQGHLSTQIQCIKETLGEPHDH